jgi:hypothetical protein
MIGGRTFEGVASDLEFVANIVEALRGKSEAEVDSLDSGRSWFVSVNIRVEAGSDPLVDVEFDSDDVGGFWVGGLGEIKTFMGEEVSLIFASVTPGGSESWCVAGPNAELLPAGKFRVIGEKLEDRGIAGSDQLAEIVGEVLRERLFSALWPVWFPRIARELFELGDGGHGWNEGRKKL